MVQIFVVTTRRMYYFVGRAWANARAEHGAVAHKYMIMTVIKMWSTIEQPSGHRINRIHKPQNMRQNIQATESTAICTTQLN